MAKTKAKKTRFDIFLKKYNSEENDTKVTLNVTSTLGHLRTHHDVLKGMTIRTEAAAAANKSPSTSQKAKPTAQKASSGNGQKRATSRITLDGVLKAISKNHETPKSIADALKANPRQVAKALSRYLKAGHVERVGPGQYRLPS